MREPFRLFHSDNMAILQTLDENSIDSIVTDPPYGLGKEPDAMNILRDWLDSGHHLAWESRVNGSPKKLIQEAGFPPIYSTTGAKLY
ncbi:site-specific DNA-methyltransferase [Leptospirillum ferriphilum]|uniref:Uncharacterized protein n=1 Tax=Leptospirillum ferriphilum TaxID=178606 RepID=A0A2I2MH08_9BACT|nr:site-specific DNA-methyltransferase [Leptospirillum ferriphilum]